MIRNLLIIICLIPSIAYANCPELPTRNEQVFKSEEITQSQIEDQVKIIAQALAHSECIATNVKYSIRAAKYDASIKVLQDKAKSMTAGTDKTNIEDFLAKVEKLKAESIKTEWGKKADNLCKPYEDDKLTYEMNHDDFEKTKINNMIKKYEYIEECYKHLDKGIKEETSLRKDAIGKDLLIKEQEILQEHTKNNTANLETVKDDAKIFENNNEQILEYFKKKDALDDIASTELYYATFQVGLKFSPEYDDNGDNQGFDKSNAFGSLIFDTRWEFPKNANVSWHQSPFRAVHPGVSIDFMSADIVNCDKLPAAEQATCRSDQVSLKDLNFNDISDTVNASFNLWGHFYQSPKKQVEVGVGGRIGMQSREKLKDNGDSVNQYNTYGVRIVFNDFVLPKYKDKGFKNGMPRFSLEYSRAEFEDYAGIGERDRHLVYGKYRIVEDSPVYIGMNINAGEGLDEIALTLSYGLKAENFINFLN